MSTYPWPVFADGDTERPLCDQFRMPCIELKTGILRCKEEGDSDFWGTESVTYWMLGGVRYPTWKAAREAWLSARKGTGK
jgi:hypothetical protein